MYVALSLSRRLTGDVSLVWSMAQASKAIVPKDLGGPCGQRIGVTVAASLNKTFLVGAYVINSTDCNQYSLVVLNSELPSDAT